VDHGRLGQHLRVGDHGRLGEELQHGVERLVHQGGVAEDEMIFRRVVDNGPLRELDALGHDGRLGGGHELMEEHRVLVVRDADELPRGVHQMRARHVRAGELHRQRVGGRAPRPQ